MGIKNILSPIHNAISIRDFSRRFFRKPAAWFYDRLEGRGKDGTPAEFTQDKINTIITSLLTLSEDLQLAAYDLAFHNVSEDDRKQRLAVRMTYYKPATPVHAVVALDDEEWMSFLKADDGDRICSICRIIGMESMESSFRAIQWVPLNQRKYLMRR